MNSMKSMHCRIHKVSHAKHDHQQVRVFTQLNKIMSTSLMNKSSLQLKFVAKLITATKDFWACFGLIETFWAVLSCFEGKEWREIFFSCLYINTDKFCLLSFALFLQFLLNHFRTKLSYFGPNSAIWSDEKYVSEVYSSRLTTLLLYEMANSCPKSF